MEWIIWMFRFHCISEFIPRLAAWDSFVIERSWILRFKFSISIAVSVGKIYYHQDKVDDAVVCLEEALRIKKSKLGQRHISLAETEHLLASLYVKKGKFLMAIPLLQSVLLTFEGVQDCEIVKSDAFDLLGSAYAQTGDNEKAISSYEQSLKIKKAILGQDDVACANVLTEIGKLNALMDDVNDALVAFKEGNCPY